MKKIILLFCIYSLTQCRRHMVLNNQENEQKPEEKVEIDDYITPGTIVFASNLGDTAKIYYGHDNTLYTSVNKNFFDN